MPSMAIRAHAAQVHRLEITFSVAIPRACSAIMLFALLERRDRHYEEQRFHRNAVHRSSYLS